MLDHIVARIQYAHLNSSLRFLQEQKHDQVISMTYTVDTHL